MDSITESAVAQNPVLGAEILWHAAKAYCDTAGDTGGIPFAALFLILPIAWHKRSAESVAARNRPGALQKAVAANREIRVHLQARVEALTETAWQSLNVGLSSGLLALNDGPGLRVRPGRATSPFRHLEADVQVALRAARRIGQAIAETSFDQLCWLLSVRF